MLNTVLNGLAGLVVAWVALFLFVLVGAFYMRAVSRLERRKSTTLREDWDELKRVGRAIASPFRFVRKLLAGLR